MKEKEVKQGAVKPVATAKKAKADTKNAYRVLVKPLISEKNTYLKAENKYVFQVAKEVNKVEIKKAILALYDARPLKIRIINVAGKDRRYGRVTGRTKDFKKAIVTMPQGVSLDIYEGV